MIYYENTNNEGMAKYLGANSANTHQTLQRNSNICGHKLRMQKRYHNPLPYISEMCNTNLCGYGIWDNIQHRLLECVNNEKITELYNKLTRLKVQLAI
jgi:hypothetical protein